MGEVRSEPSLESRACQVFAKLVATFNFEQHCWQVSQILLSKKAEGRDPDGVFWRFSSSSHRLTLKQLPVTDDHHGRPRAPRQRPF